MHPCVCGGLLWVLQCPPTIRRHAVRLIRCEWLFSPYVQGVACFSGPLILMDGWILQHLPLNLHHKMFFLTVLHYLKFPLCTAAEQRCLIIILFHIRSLLSAITDLSSSNSKHFENSFEFISAAKALHSHFPQTSRHSLGSHCFLSSLERLVMSTCCFLSTEAQFEYLGSKQLFQGHFSDKQKSRSVTLTSQLL